jgi:hypothetical protein
VPGTPTTAAPGRLGPGRPGGRKGSRVCRIRRRHTCDEFGDQPLAEIAAVRVAGLPPERDLYFEPRRLSEIEAHLARHGSGP